MDKLRNEMYFNLLKNTLLDNIYGSIVGRFGKQGNTGWNGSDVIPDFVDKGIIATPENIMIGNIWPLRAHTMIGMKRLNNIQWAVEQVMNNNIDGDFIETGVWRGGASIFLAALNKYYNLNRKVYVADSFEGLPNTLNGDSRYPDDIRHPGGEMAISLETVKSNFKKYDVLDETVVFIKGFFETSLKNVNFNKLSILRLDGDFYCSTIQVLDELYDKVST